LCKQREFLKSILLLKIKDTTMQKSQLNPKMSVLLAIIVMVASMRLINSSCIHPLSNFTPIGAMGLFGGAYFSQKWKAFLFPILTLLISDLVINNFIFEGKYGVMYSGWYWIYGIFALIVFLGSWIIQKVTFKNVLVAAIVASLSHWLLADLTVWIGGGTDLRTGGPLSRDWQGLVQCYVQGLPFLKNFLMGTLFYSAIMFGAVEYAKVYYPKAVLA
jgi:hypothetical protein